MDWALDVADELRRNLMRTAVSLEPLRVRLLDRGARLRLLGMLAVCTSAMAALFFPYLSLWLGAAFLGVPHVVAGVRHQAMVRPLNRFARVAAVAGCALGVAMAAGAGAWAWRSMPVVFAVALASQGASTERRAVRLLAPVVALALAAAFFAWPYATAMVLSHAHAVGTVAFFAWTARRRRLGAGSVSVAAVVVAAAGLSGMLDPLLPATPLLPASSAASLRDTLAQLAPGGTSPLMLRRLLFVFAFGQALHYMVWLRLMPEVDRPAPVPQSFRRAFQAFGRDFGRWTWPTLLVCVAAPAAILLGGDRGRETYFAVVYFHMALEAAALLGLLRQTAVVDHQTAVLHHHDASLGQALRRALVTDAKLEPH
jgi:hypothetical protein